ncbi:ParA family protein [Patescibacteria group bacterium]
MARVIAFANQKGGVGKTTSIISIGAYLTKHKKKVLIIDSDSQGNASSGLGYKHAEDNHTLYHVLTGKVPIQKAILGANLKYLHLLPSSNELAGATIELVNQEEREFQLKKILGEIEQDYDYILIDCPPSLGLITINALTAAKEVIVPVQCEYYALEGLGHLLHTIELVKERLNPDLAVTGAILTMHDKRTNISSQVIDEVRAHFPHRVFETVVPRNVRLAEAPSFGKTIMEYNRNSKGAKAYQKLVKEIINLEHHE